MKIVSNEYGDMIFRSEKDGKVRHSIGLSTKDENGNYVNDYFPVRFKGSVDVANQTKIFIKDGFMAFNKFTTEDGKNVSYKYVMVTDFTTETKIEENKKSNDNMDVFEEFGKETKELSEDEFPW